MLFSALIHPPEILNKYIGWCEIYLHIKYVNTKKPSKHRKSKKKLESKITWMRKKKKEIESN